MPTPRSPVDPSSASPATKSARLDREDLLMFHAAPDRVAPVRTTAEWLQRRAEILAGMQTVMGPLPGVARRGPLAVRIEHETDCGSYVRREITYQAEPGSRVPAYLLLPKAVLRGNTQQTGVLCLMPTNDEGNRAVVGLALAERNRGVNYGEELALRGYPVIAPPYPLLAGYEPDLSALGYASGTMKAVWDNIRALDVLAETPGVVPMSFGAIGHSLGGHNAIYTAVFDERIRAVVSSCGFDSFLDYGDETSWQPGEGWAQPRYMPRSADHSREDMPFDFHELLGALAPRAFFASAPLHDSNFKWHSVDRVIAAARPVYQFHGLSTKLAVEHPSCGHEFPPATRETAYRWLERYCVPGLRQPDAPACFL